MKDKNVQQQATLIPTLPLFQLYRKTGKMEINISEIKGVVSSMDNACNSRKIREYLEKVNAEEWKISKNWATLDSSTTVRNSS